MANHSSGDQISYVIQWFGTWSDFQKDDFVDVIAPKVSPNPQVNGIVNGVNNLDTSGRPPSLFACQVKLFNEWWNNWNEADREKMLNQLKNVDSKFWAEVESELSGTRKKSNEDFFAVAITNETAPVTVPDAANNGSSNNNNNNTDCDPDNGEENGKDIKKTSPVPDESSSGSTPMDDVVVTAETVEIKEETSPVEV